MLAIGAVHFVHPRSALAACTYGSCAPSNVVISSQVTQQASSQTATLIADRISQAVAGFGGTSFAAVPGFESRGPVFALGNGGGKAAGSLPKNLGVWADVGNLWLRNSQAGAEYEGQIFTALAGFDYLFHDRILLGFAAGYERIDLDTGFNSGTLKSSGWAAAIYGGLILAPDLSIDFQVGHAWVDYSQAHGATGSFKGDRWFGSTNLNAKQSFGNWRFAESFGYFHVNENQDAYVESNGNQVDGQTAYVGQVRVKGTVGYWMPMDWGSLMPYASTRLDFDVTKSAAPVINSQGQTTDNGDFGATFALGVTARTGPSMTGTIEATTTQFRRDFESYGLKGTMRVQF